MTQYEFDVHSNTLLIMIYFDKCIKNCSCVGQIKLYIIYRIIIYRITTGYIAAKGIEVPK